MREERRRCCSTYLLHQKIPSLQWTTTGKHIYTFLFKTFRFMVVVLMAFIAFVLRSANTTPLICILFSAQLSTVKQKQLTLRFHCVSRCDLSILCCASCSCDSHCCLPPCIPVPLSTGVLASAPLLHICRATVGPQWQLSVGTDTLLVNQSTPVPKDPDHSHYVELMDAARQFLVVWVKFFTTNP